MLSLFSCQISGSALTETRGVDFALSSITIKGKTHCVYVTLEVSDLLVHLFLRCLLKLQVVQYLLMYSFRISQPYLTLLPRGLFHVRYSGILFHDACAVGIFGGRSGWSFESMTSPAEYSGAKRHDGFS